MKRCDWQWLSGYQVVFRDDSPAISGAWQNVKYQTQPEPATAFFTGALDFEGFACYSGSADLRTPGTCEIQHATESGSQLEGCLNRFHVKDFVA